jgi:hypothetical protein
VEFAKGTREGFLVLGDEGYEECLLTKFGRVKRAIRNGIYGGVVEMAGEVVRANGHGMG